MPDYPPLLLSLFSGLGGLDLGFERAGFHPLIAIDNDPAAVETYNWNRRNRSNCAHLADLSSIRPQVILDRWQDISLGRSPVGVIGGPPCQAFSISNVNRLKDDPRALLPLSFARILKAFNQRYLLHFFVFENVAGLGTNPHSHSLSKFVEAFADAGFSVTYFFLDAADFSVPQHRRRMFIVGLNSSLYPPTAFSPPRGNGIRTTTRDAIGHLPEPVRYARGLDPRGFGLHPNHWCLNPKSPKFTNGKLEPGKMLGRSFRMLLWDKPSWTVAYGHREVHVHPNGHRRLSVFEAMCLQSLPPEYELRGTLSDQIRLVSDAVPPPVATAIAGSIRDLLPNNTHAEFGKLQPDINGQAAQLGFQGLQTLAPKSTRA